jgi:hypothetical protein
VSRAPFTATAQQKIRGPHEKKKKHAGQLSTVPVFALISALQQQLSHLCEFVQIVVDPCTCKSSTT